MVRRTRSAANLRAEEIPPSDDCGRHCRRVLPAARCLIIALASPGAPLAPSSAAGSGVACGRFEGRCFPHGAPCAVRGPPSGPRLPCS